MGRSIRTLGVVALVLVGMAGAASAQDGGASGLSAEQSKRVAGILDKGFATCTSVAEPYRPDCFQQVYRSGAKIFAHNAAYWEAEVALTRVGRTLIAFVRANGDSSADRLRAGGFRMKAITASAVPEARKLYSDSATQAEGLLRNVGSRELKYFAPVADVIGRHTSLSK